MLPPSTGLLDSAVESFRVFNRALRMHRVWGVFSFGLRVFSRYYAFAYEAVLA